MGPRFRVLSRGRLVERLAPVSHRRRNAVAADIDAVGFQHAVVFLHRAEDDDLGARFHFGLVAGNEGDDRRIRRHHDLLLAVLVFDQDVLAVGALDRLGHRGVGHGRARALIPGPKTFGGAALVLGENVHRDRLLDAIGLRHRGDADV